MKNKKVVHILGQLDVGGIESWLVDVAKKTASSIDYTFVVDKPHKGFYEDLLISLGCKIVHVSSPKKPVKYLANLFFLFRKSHFDICHSHVGYTNGVVALIAKLSRIPSVITHGHSDHRIQHARSGWLKRGVIDLKIRMANVFADHRIAVSNGSAQCHYKTMASPVEIVPCGKDFESLVTAGPTTLKMQLGINPKCFVLGTVGRLENVKNHRFLIELLSLYKNDNVALLLVGDGSLMDELKALAKELDVSERVIFLGAKTDALIIMRDVMDLFLFPSLHEGLGLAAIEAQAAGLSVIASDNVPSVIDVTGKVSHIKIDDREAWKLKIDGFINSNNKSTVNLDIVHGPFSIEKNIVEILRLYNVA